MDPKKFLAVLIIFLFTVVSSPERPGLKRFSETKVFSSAGLETAFTGYTYEKVLINGVWWIRDYDDKGAFVEEFPAD